ncbi:cysteine proteinase [Cladochytrium replicatum]|nr:cysteine proteinase [Cladochytrium replicatum]
MPNLKSRLIKPRGLINNGNMCFMNAILQPLVHCAPFYNFFMQFRHAYTMSLKTKTPLLEAMIMFLNEFREASPDSPKEQKSLSEEANSESFAPEYVYDALRALKKLDSQKGRQEDAEEFLGFLLDGLHEELLSLMSNGSPESKSAVNSSSDDEWTQVGRKNKPTVVRSTEVVESPIYHMFGGRMRSVLKSSGNKQSATLEPFQSLQIDIAPDQVKTIEDGLRRLTAVETLEGFTSIKGGKVDATKQTLIESLPPILILHLKRFHYDSTTGTTQKLQKHVAYSTTLKIDPEIISPTARKDVGSNPQYTLFAVVNHHGKQTTGGHYTCDVARGSTGEWLRMDDTVIKPVPATDVLAEKSDRQAYMLFFCQS